MDTAGLYLQVPFCASKCSFCNFSSRAESHKVYDRYYQALLSEIERLPEFYRSAGMGCYLLQACVDSVYIGGGTPSLFGKDRLAAIIATLRKWFKIASSAEFTLEVTPGSADGDLLARAVALGINRLSIGAQSFADGELRAVGRLHSAEDTRTLIHTARAQGFANISLDLIAGLPYQSEDSWQLSLESTVAVQPEHISVYLFEIDEKSRLGREVLQHGTRYHGDKVPDEDFVADAYEKAREFLRGYGYVQYEISNFAHPGFDSAHNRKYWQLKPYFGLGAGAHSFDGESRWANVTQVDEYEGRLQRGESPIEDQRTLSPETWLEEFLFLGLRQRDGIDLADAESRWGRQMVERWARKIESLRQDGWLECANGRVRLADSALLVSNEVFQEFIGA
jgi:putative oxygen-independent coproporphyrinogen III oxidase